MGFGSTTGFGNRPKYTLTSAPEGTSTVYFQSISAMPAYKTKSFEELRFEDYSSGRVNQMGKTFGTPHTLGFDRHLPTQTTGLGFGKIQQQSTPFGSKTGFGGGSIFGPPKYIQTPAPEGTDIVYFQSISAMYVYSTKSFEELRFEDYSTGRVNKMGKTIVTPQPLGFDRHLTTQTTGLGFDANQEKKKEMERKFEEEKRNLEAEKKKLEDEKRKLVEEKNMKAKKKLEEEKTKLEEGRKKLEEEKRKKIEEDMKKLEEERRMVEEEKKKIERERKNLELQSIFHFQKKLNKK